MPFKSKAQARMMFARHPRMAKRWAEETPDMAALPDKKKRPKNESAGITVSRSVLQRIVFEELLRATGRLSEAADDEEEAPEGKKEPKLADASKGKGPVPPAGKGPSATKTVPSQPGKPPAQKPPEKGKRPAAAPEEVPDEPDPADDDIEGDGDSEGGELNDELSGKTIQSMSMEPKSKLVAGATEIVLTFNETTDPLRIIVTKTGVVRFFYRGALHNMV